MAGSISALVTVHPSGSAMQATVPLPAHMSMLTGLNCGRHRVYYEGDRLDPGIPTLAETPSLLHYTSGTTGQPKGVKHVHYSLIAQYLTAKWVLDIRPDDIYWCTADPGWVTGTSYGIIGPWSLGVTQCVMDSGFSAEAWYKFIEKHRVTNWYSAPTAIRSLMKAGDEVIKLLTPGS